MEEWVVVAEWNGTDVYGTWPSKKEALYWLKNEHLTEWNEDYEEFLCADHDQDFSEHGVAMIDQVV
jgi:hypothetical protein